MSARLISEEEAELRGERVEAAAAGDHEGRRREMPKIAPEAPTVSRVRIGERERAEGAGEERGEVEGDEARACRSPARAGGRGRRGANMLKPMWMRPAWRKPPVTSRYHSPSATAGPAGRSCRRPSCWCPLRPPLPPAISARKAATLSAIRTKVAGAAPAAEGAPARAAPRVRWLRALRAAHADRGRRHALGTDRPPAGGAGDAGLAVRDGGSRSGPSGLRSLQSGALAPAKRERWTPSPARLYATLVGACS